MRTAKRDVAKIYLVTGLSIALLTVCFFLFGFLPLNQLLRDAHARGVYYFLENNTQLVDVVIEKHIDIARQMASRTMIRHALRDYDVGKLARAELIAYTQPRLLDAVKHADEVLGLTRYDRHGAPLVEIGIPVDAQPCAKAVASTHGVKVVGPVTVNDATYLLYCSEIVEGEHGQIGLDAMAMRLQDLASIINIPLSNEGNLFLAHGGILLIAPERPVEDGLRTVLTGYLHDRAPHPDYLIEGRAVDNAGWTLYLVVRKDRFFSAIQQDVTRLVIILIVITAVVFIATIVVLNPILATLLREQALLEMSQTDAMTGLYNRRHFDEVLDKELNRAARHHEVFSLMLLDIDYFKRINDTYGHLQGDAVLQTLSRLIRSTVRDADIAARHGGEEFAVLLPHTDKRGALDLAERLRAGAQALAIDADGHAIRFTVSLGVTTYDPAHGKRSRGEVVAAMDRALYASKGNGRNRVSYADS